MDLTAMYLASPDFVKAIWSVAPFVTIVALAHILARRPRRGGEVRAVPFRPLLLEAEGEPAVVALASGAGPSPDKEKAPREEGPGKSG